MRTLLTGLGFGESPRWHGGRLWFCNWGTGEIVSVSPEGESRVETVVPVRIPYCINWLTFAFIGALVLGGLWAVRGLFLKR